MAQLRGKIAVLYLTVPAIIAYMIFGSSIPLLSMFISYGIGIIVQIIYTFELQRTGYGLRIIGTYLILLGLFMLLDTEVPDYIYLISFLVGIIISFVIQKIVTVVNSDTIRKQKELEEEIEQLNNKNND